MSLIQHPSNRLYFIDWLRIIAFSFLILLHVGDVFKGHWLINNAESSEVITAFNYFVGRFRIPLLFLISGVGVSFAIKNKSARQFLQERYHRLIIPLVFGIIFFIPPQQFLYELFRNQNDGNYVLFLLKYWADFFNPSLYMEKGIFFRTQHLWFLHYLFLFTVISLPLTIFFTTEKGMAIQAKLIVFLTKQNLVSFLLVLFMAYILVDLCVLLISNVPILGKMFISSQMKRFGSCIFFYNLGFLLGKSVELWAYIGKRLPYWLMIGIAFYTALILSTNVLSKEVLIFSMAIKLISLLNIIAWVLVVLGLGQRFLNFEHPFVKYANTAVYPFYIIHQPILVLFAFWVVKFELNLYLKYLLLIVLTFGISYLCYEFFIKRVTVLRPYFGLKNLPKAP